MARRNLGTTGLLLVVLVCVAALSATAQSFRVQCPTSTITHPTAANNNSEPAYTGPTTFTMGPNGYLVPSTKVNGAIKCQQISGGDGYSTMGDGTQTYMFSFGPLSCLADLAACLPASEFPTVFNTPWNATSAANRLKPGDPATTDGTLPTIPASPGAISTYLSSFNYNGAVGQQPDTDCLAANAAAGTGPLPCPGLPTTGIAGHVDPRQIMDVGVMNGNIPAPLMAIDEDDEVFLTLTNVGMIMRPDLFEQHTVHFHGYPNASAFYDGVPDASVAINIGGSFTY